MEVPSCDFSVEYDFIDPLQFTDGEMRRTQPCGQGGGVQRLPECGYSVGGYLLVIEREPKIIGCELIDWNEADSGRFISKRVAQVEVGNYSPIDDSDRPVTGVSAGISVGTEL
jgi:hypothetical protein